MGETYSKLAVKIVEGRHWRQSGVFIFEIEQISHIVLVFPILTWNKNFWLGHHFIALFRKC